MNFYIMSKDVAVAKWHDNNLEVINENLEGMKKILGVLGEFTKKEDPKAGRKSSVRPPRRYDD